MSSQESYVVSEQLDNPAPEITGALSGLGLREQFSGPSQQGPCCTCFHILKQAGSCLKCGFPSPGPQETTRALDSGSHLILHFVLLPSWDPYPSLRGRQRQVDNRTNEHVCMRNLTRKTVWQETYRKMGMIWISTPETRPQQHEFWRDCS